MLIYVAIADSVKSTAVICRENSVTLMASPIFQPSETEDSDQCSIVALHMYRRIGEYCSARNGSGRRSPVIKPASPRTELKSNRAISIATQTSTSRSCTSMSAEFTSFFVIPCRGALASDELIRKRSWLRPVCIYLTLLPEVFAALPHWEAYPARVPLIAGCCRGEPSIVEIQA